MPPSPRGQHPQALCAALAHGLNAAPVAICLVNLQAAVCVWRVNIDLLPPRGFFFFFPLFPFFPRWMSWDAWPKGCPPCSSSCHHPLAPKPRYALGMGVAPLFKAANAKRKGKAALPPVPSLLCSLSPPWWHRGGGGGWSFGELMPGS